MRESLESRAIRWLKVVSDDPRQAAEIGDQARGAHHDWRILREAIARRGAKLPQLAKPLERAGIARDPKLAGIDDHLLEMLAVRISQSRRPLCETRPKEKGWTRIQVAREDVSHAAHAISSSTADERGRIHVEECHDGVATFLANTNVLAVPVYERNGRTFRPTGASYHGRDAVCYLEATFGMMPFRSIDVLARFERGSASQRGFEAAVAKSEDILIGETMIGVRRAAQRIAQVGEAKPGLVARTLGSGAER